MERFLRTRKWSLILQIFAQKLDNSNSSSVSCVGADAVVGASLPLGHATWLEAVGEAPVEEVQTDGAPKPKHRFVPPKSMQYDKRW